MTPRFSKKKKKNYGRCLCLWCVCVGGGGGGGGAGISLLEGKLDGSLFLGGKLDGCCFFIPWFKAHYLIVATVLSASHPHPT